MQAIGQLAGGVAHDFNNLLTAISGHCDLLLLRSDEGDPNYADLIQIHQNSNRAASLVNQLLAFSRRQSFSPEIVDLNDLIEDLTHLLNRLVGENVVLAFDADPNVSATKVDRRQLEQVIMNLVVNARDAMPTGGKVLIKTETLFLSQGETRGRATLLPGKYSIIKVVDEGIGISSENMQKIFEPFFTTKKVGEGTGLGLSTAYGIVKQSGGYIFAESAVGIGTTLTVYLPAVAQKPKSDIKNPLSSASNNKHAFLLDKTILVVEDEAPVAAFVARALRLRGATVELAIDGENALMRFKESKLKYDLVITDVVMPNLDGPTWVSQALSKYYTFPVIFTSGYAQELVPEISAQTKSAFLAKPFSLLELTQLAEHLIEGN